MYFYVYVYMYISTLPTESTTITMQNLHSLNPQRRWPSSGTRLASAGRRQVGCRGETLEMEAPYHWDMGYD